MKNLFLAYSLSVLLLSYISSAQSVMEGNWTGVLHQNPTPQTPFTEYKFSMKLQEKDGVVTGVSTLITGPNFGILDLNGSVTNDVFTFQEYKIEKENPKKSFDWCLKSGALKLTTVGTTLKMEGDWKGYAMHGNVRAECSPGKIVLIKEEGFISLKGYVVDEKNTQPVPAHIKIVNKASGKQEAVLNTSTGEFDIKLPGKNEYELTVESKGYLTRYEHVQLAASTVLNLAVKPIEVGQTVSLKNILFQKSTSELTADSYPELERLDKFLESNPAVNIELQGHTSNEGDADKNIQLSQQRVEVIKTYLVSKGIHSSRIHTKAFGAQKPIVPNDTEENRKLNRRVEFLILNK